MRIVFRKIDNAKFISHLDLVRCFTRIFNRAEIPVSQTQGFHPHPYMVFSPPLSLGILSSTELLDIKTDKVMPPEEVKEALDKAVPSGITIADVYEDGGKLSNIASAEYVLTLSLSAKSDLEKFLAQDKIEIEKKAKKGGFKTIDIKDGMTVKSIEEIDNNIILKINLPCGSEKNIGVNLFRDAFLNFAEVKDFKIEIERTTFYDIDGNIFR